MPYDSNLDQQVFSKGWENDGGKIVVSVYSYNNGPKKMQIIREIKNREGVSNFAKLGRLSKEELEAQTRLADEVLEEILAEKKTDEQREGS